GSAGCTVSAGNDRRTDPRSDPLTPCGASRPDPQGRRWARAKQLIRGNPERLGDLRHHNHCWIPNSSFYSTDIGPVQLGLERQFLLRELSRLAQASDIDAHLLPDIHGPEQAAL